MAVLGSLQERRVKPHISVGVGVDERLFDFGGQRTLIAFER